MPEIELNLMKLMKWQLIQQTKPGSKQTDGIKLIDFHFNSSGTELKLRNQIIN